MTGRIARVAARTRAQCPAAFITVPFVAAQVMACGAVYYAGLVAGVAVCLLGAIPLLLRDKSHALFFVAGALSGCVSVGSEIAPGRDLQLYVLVADEPQHRRPGEVTFIGRVLGGSREEIVNRYLSFSAVHLPWRNSHNLASGDRIIVRADITGTKGSLFSYEGQLRRLGVSGIGRIKWLTRAGALHPTALGRLRESARVAFDRQYGPDERGGLMRALVLGHRNGISDLTKEAFRRLGLAHVLIFSGYQVSLLYFFLTGLARAAIRPPLWRRFPLLSRSLNVTAHVCSVLVVTLLVIVAGIEGSSMRAQVSLVLLVILGLTERGGGFWQRLSVALLVLHLIWPGCILDAGVQLTVGALIGLHLGAGLSERKIFSGAFACVSATLITSAVGALWFGNLPVYAILFNFIAAPILSIAGTVGGGLGVVVAEVGGGRWLGDVCLWVVISLRDWIVELSRSPSVLVELAFPANLVCAVFLLLPFALAGRSAAIRRIREWNIQSADGYERVVGGRPIK